MIAVVVSQLNRCFYWIEAHGEDLRSALKKSGKTDFDKIVEQIKKDYKKGDVDEKSKAVLEYAEKLTLRPSEMVAEDVEKLRRFGWSDNQILEVVHIVGYFNYINRVVDGLGCEWEEEMKRNNLMLTKKMEFLDQEFIQKLEFYQKKYTSLTKIILTLISNF